MEDWSTLLAVQVSVGSNTLYAGGNVLVSALK